MSASAAASAQARAHRLCPAAVEVDRALARMDRTVDWLTRLTPINVDEVWAAFRDSGFRDMPDSRFGEGLVNDVPGLRKTLFALPVREIENPLIEALLIEKQREIDRQIELVRMRGQDGFIVASTDLFGHVSEQLLQTARDLLETVPVFPPDGKDADAETVCEVARSAVAGYRERHPDFSCKVIVDPMPGTSMYMTLGNLHVACDYRTARSRVVPLIAHEIGTHAVTRYNGHRQPLHTLAGGLADYDLLQEGLAVLAEYLAGYLPATRLRTLAARVIAAHMAVQESSGADIYACLVEECRIDGAAAFDTAVRAKRGGGLTKDALYLEGLAELLSYLSHGGDFEILFLGKFALKQLHSLQRLVGDGILHPPEILPSYLEDPAAVERLARVRTLPLAELYQESPET